MPFTPCVSRLIHFFKRVHDIVVMQRYVRNAFGGAIACVEGCVPLLVLITKTNHDEICPIDIVTRANCIDSTRLLISPKARFDGKIKSIYKSIALELREYASQ